MDNKKERYFSNRNQATAVAKSRAGHLINSDFGNDDVLTVTFNYDHQFTEEGIKEGKKQMSNRRSTNPSGQGRYARAEDAEAIRAREAAYKQQIVREENEAARRKRGKRVGLGLALLVMVAMMITFIQYGLISDILAVAFSSILAATIGCFMR